MSKKLLTVILASMLVLSYGWMATPPAMAAPSASATPAQPSAGEPVPALVSPGETGMGREDLAPMNEAWAPTTEEQIATEEQVETEGPIDVSEYGTGLVLPVADDGGASWRPGVRAAPVPGSWDLREYAVPAGNQGSLNSCTSWAVAYTLMGWYARQAGRGGQAFAPMYAHAQVVDGLPNEAASFGQIFDIAVRQGIDTVDDYMPQGNYDYITLPTDAQRAHAAASRFTGYTLYYQDSYHDKHGMRAALQEAISAGQPVVIGIENRDGFRTYHPSDLSVAITDTSSAPSSLGHSVVALAYDSNGLIVENSWGPQWGVNGFGRLSWDVVDHDVSVAYVATGYSAQPTTPTVSTTSATWDAPSSGGWFTLDGVSSAAWKLSSAPSWVTVTQTSGFGVMAQDAGIDGASTPVMMQATANTSSTSRSGSVTFVTDVGNQSATASVTVTQPGGWPGCGVGQGSSGCAWPDLSVPVSGSILPSNDSDTWRITPSTSGVWTFQVARTGDAPPGAYVDLQVQTTSGIRVSDTPGGMGVGWATATASLVAGQSYTVQVKARTRYIGQYALVATAPSVVPELTVARTSWDVGTGGPATVAIPVSSNTAWTVSSNVSWLSTSVIGGAGGGVVTASASVNGLEGRTGTLTFTSSGKSPVVTRTVTVNQPMRPVVWSGLGRQWTVTSAAAESASCWIGGDTTWRVSSDQPWLSATPSSGSPGQPLTCAVMANPGASPRSGVLTFTTTSGLPQVSRTVEVWQPGTAVAPSVTTEIPQWWVPSSIPTTASMTVTATAAWTASSNVPWLTVSPSSGAGTGDVVLSASANTASSSRSGVVTFTTTSGSPKATWSLPVTQPGMMPGWLTLDTVWWVAPSAASETTLVAVSSNHAWQATPDHPWVTVSPASGVGNGVVAVTAAASGIADSRSATVTFTTVTGSPQVTKGLTLTQPGVDTRLEVDKTSWSVSSSAAVTSVAVSSNTSWTVTSDQSWVSVATPSGSGDSTLSVTAAENETVSSRTATLTFATTVGMPVRTMTMKITQAAAKGSLSVDRTSWSAPSSAAASTTVSVSSNTSWSVSSDATWLTASPTEGSGSSTMTLKAAANATVDARKAVVTVTTTSGSSTISQMVSVSQPGVVPVVSVDKDVWELASPAAVSLTVAVSSNAAWMVTSNQTWMTIPKLTGSYDGAVTLNLTANESSQPRTAVAKFVTDSGSPAMTKTVTVTQPGVVVPSLALDTTTWTLASSAAATSTVHVTSNQSWTVSSDQSWVTVSPGTGSNNGTVTLTAVANASVSSRVATVTFATSTGALARAVTVSQPGAAPTVSTGVSQWVVPSSGQNQVSVSVSSNTTWKMSSDQAWLTVSPGTGTGNGSVSLTAGANTAVTARTATVTVTTTSGATVQTATVTVSQPGAVVALSLDKATWALGSSATANITVAVTSNAAWKVVSDQTWLTVSPGTGTGNGSVTLTAGANTAVTARTATVTVTTTSGSTVQTAKVSVSQPGAAVALSLDKATWALGSSATASIAVAVTSNAGWKVTSDQSWLTVSPGTGTGNGSVTLTASANATVDSRPAVVTFTTTTGATVQTAKVSVSQPGAAPTVSTGVSQWVVPSSGQNQVSVSVSSNTTWKVSSDQSWVTVSPATGTGNATVSLTASANTAVTARTATVTFTTTSGTPVQTATVSVSQPGAPAVLSLDKATWALASSASAITTVQATSNTAWKVVSDQTWVTVSPGTGTGNATVTLSASPNASTSSRAATVTFTTAGSVVQTKTVSVSQPGAAVALSVDMAAWTVPSSSAASVLVQVSSNANWKISSNQAWLTATPATGSGDGKVTLSAAANKDSVARAATVTVTTTSGSTVVTKTVSVSQPRMSLTLDMSEWLVGSNASAGIFVAVSSWSAWKVTSSQPWLSSSEVPGSGGSSAYVLATYNPGTDARTGTLTYTTTVAPIETATLTVTQPGTSPAPSVSLTLDKTSWSLGSSSAGSTSVAVSSNRSWTASSNQSWVTVSPATGTNNGTVTLSAVANTTSTSRAAVVTFTTTGSPALSRTVAVSQPGASSGPTLSVGLSAWSVPSSDAAQVSTSVSSSTTWKASSDQSWVTVSPGSGDGNASVMFTAQANTTASARTATVTFTTTTGSPAAVQAVTVSQPGTQAGSGLSLSLPQWDVPSKYATGANVQVTSSGSWSVVSSDPSWLSVSAWSGSGQRFVAMNATANTGAARVGTLTFSTTSGVASSATVTVYQPGVTPAPSPSPSPTPTPSPSPSPSPTPTPSPSPSPTPTPSPSPTPGPTLRVGISTWVVPLSVAASITTSFSSSTAWSAASDQSWLSVTPRFGTSSTTAVALVTLANTGMTARTATVTFTTTAVGPQATQTVTVIQPGAQGPELSLDLSTWTLSSNSSDHVYMNVVTTSVWTATTSDASWLTMTPTSGVGSKEVYVYATVNQSPSQRTATLTFTTAAGARATLTVTQPGKGQ
ncbi:MAG: hypothetical protein FWD75_10635 [Propionibacteriaceae bacterium]|nr:hypothetical protein [Propionibacteriaceae bacterium]